MMLGIHVPCLLVALVTRGSGQQLHVTDLTHTHGPDTVYWPGNPKNNFTILVRSQNVAGGYWYEANYFGTPEHGGTHLDAPAHFYKGKHRSQQIPMDKLAGPGVVINVKDKVRSNPDYRITVQDFEAWEARNGKIPTGAVVLMNSGWSDYYPDKTLVFGSQSANDPSTFHFPAFHEDAITWLLSNRNVHVVGVDTPSVDYGQSKTFPVHVLLGEANIPGAENVAYLDLIPESGTMVYVAAIKLFDGSGGPARVFATYMDMDTSSGPVISASMYLAIVCQVLCFHALKTI